MDSLCFQPFNNDISAIPLPVAFTFPFYYTPHPLAKIAARALQNYLKAQNDFVHNFGFDNTQNGLVIGKMFGVLVCQHPNGTLGYLWAFSGKLANSNHHKHFVPPVFDMLKKDSFFKKEEKILNHLNAEISELENSSALQKAKTRLKNTEIEAKVDIEKQKQRIKMLKKQRDIKRKTVIQFANSDVRNQLEISLNEESKKESILLKSITKYWNYQIADACKHLENYTQEVERLKALRKEKSAALQQQLFQCYYFLNLGGETKSIGEIFNNNPPAGAGECAAPKLLNYAFKHRLKPIAMAEFWWGQSPASEVRKHLQYYPACKLKCEPILMGHMLKGLQVAENPFKKNAAQGKELSIIYEDEAIIAVNKPEEFLSVPGKEISDSVYTRIKALYERSDGPLIVHRLDMSTSGLLLLAKTKESYVRLQQQFIKRTVKKRYVALLDGILKKNEGIIDLPLRVDLDDRPRQLVCYDYGKPAITRWEVIQIKNQRTRVYFYPHTGRTHQLRVHAAHQYGLNIPILGDDLYGNRDKRLHLHAESITFIHPLTHNEMTLSVAPDF